MKRVGFALAVSLLFPLSPSTWATPVNMTYEGVVNQVPRASDSALGGLLGQTMTARVTYDLATPDAVPEHDIQGIYRRAISSFIVTIGDRTYRASQGDIWVWWSATGETRSMQYLFNTGTDRGFSGPDIGSSRVHGLVQLNFNFPFDPATIPSDDLPTRPPNPSQFEESFLEVPFCEVDAAGNCLPNSTQFVDAYNNLRLIGVQISEPAPETLLALVLGAFTVTALRSRRSAASMRPSRGLRL